MEAILTMMVLSVMTTALTALLPYIWSLPFMIIPGLNEIESKNIPGVLAALNPYSSIRKSDDTPSGFIFGRWYIGLIIAGPASDKGTSNNTCYMLISKKRIQQALKHGIVINESIADQCIIESYGNAFWSEFKSEEYQLRLLEATPTQKRAIDKIEELFRERLSITVCVYGVPGSGKSSLGTLLAQRLKGKYCDTYDPTYPCHELNHVLALARPTMSCPLIIMMDEVDSMILNVISQGGEISGSKYGKQEWYNKASWNKYFDKFHSRGTQGVILIMTMNSDASVFDERDSSLLRGGRIDMCLSMKSPLNRMIARQTIEIA